MDASKPLDTDLATLAARLEARLDAIDHKLDDALRTRQKSLEWIATLSDHVSSLDAFREEVRASFEPFLHKLEGIDEVTRILRHATSDVSKRLESLEKETRRLRAG
jgi:hypothetical protein